MGRSAWDGGATSDGENNKIGTACSVLFLARCTIFKRTLIKSLGRLGIEFDEDDITEVRAPLGVV